MSFYAMGHGGKATQDKAQCGVLMHRHEVKIYLDQILITGVPSN